jgi:predicted nucleotidyltransferase
LLDLIGFAQDVEEELGVRIDAVTENALSPYLRDRILAEAVLL